jgi:hypothetical protein
MKLGFFPGLQQFLSNLYKCAILLFEDNSCVRGRYTITMELNNWTASLILLAVIISYKQLLSFYQRYLSPAPVVGNTFFDFLSGVIGNTSLGPRWYSDAYQKVRYIELSPLNAL